LGERDTVFSVCLDQCSRSSTWRSALESGIRYSLDDEAASLLYAAMLRSGEGECDEGEEEEGV